MAQVFRRHSGGPFTRVSEWVEAGKHLDEAALVDEYRGLVENAPMRSRPYIADHDLSMRRAISNRGEELLATALWERKTRLECEQWGPFQIVDLQVPLNAARGDGFGKVDLLGVGDGLYAIELKVKGSGRPDTPLNALLEVVGYCAVLEKNRMRVESELRERGVKVSGGSLHAVVLAPEDYWEYWSMRTRELAGVLRSCADLVNQTTGLQTAFGSFDIDDLSVRLPVADVSSRDTSG